MILTANLFGDIISDEGTGLTGTAGLFGSAELSVSGKGLYTPNQLHYPDESVIGKQNNNDQSSRCKVADHSLNTDRVDADTCDDRRQQSL